MVGYPLNSRKYFSMIKSITTAACVLALTTSFALAQSQGSSGATQSRDNTVNDNMNKSGSTTGMSNNGMSKDGMSKDGMKKDGMSKDNMSKDNMKK